MSWNFVELQSVPETAWKNGAGVARELVAWPNAEDWSWRISQADVVDDCAFSHYGGVERWFAVLDGPGVRLFFNDVPLLCSRMGPARRFSGDASVYCRPLGGKTRDLNLMLRGVSGRMERVRTAIGRLGLRDAVVALYAHDHSALVSRDTESITVPARTLAWQRVAEGGTYQIVGADAIWMEIGP